MARRLNASRMRVTISPRARRNILVGTLALLAFGLAVIVTAYTRACAGNSCPSIEELGGYDPNQASKVYAADGRLITDYGLERRTVVPLKQMSPAVAAAFLAVRGQALLPASRHRLVPLLRRDQEQHLQVPGGGGLLHHHHAARPEPLARRHQRTSDKGSGVAQDPRIAQVAREIEAKYAKDKILELYLNQIDLGNGAYGVEAAAQRYFGKSVRA